MLYIDIVYVGCVQLDRFQFASWNRVCHLKVFVGTQASLKLFVGTQVSFKMYVGLTCHT